MSTATVEEIHRAVDKAAETMLMDVPYNYQSAQQLNMLGFSSSENVGDVDDHRENASKARLYQQKYPMYKFITRRQMDKIRGKYNLMEGNLDRFKGAIPDKNIQDMLRFNIHREDIEVVKDEREIFADFIIEQRNQMARAFNIDPRRLDPDSPHRSRDRRDRELHGWLFDEREFFADRKQAQVVFRDAGTVNRLSFADVNQHFPGAIKITADPALFKAPDPVLDPIVTVGVKGGYLVITAWGAEAGDPDVVNQQMN